MFITSAAYKSIHIKMRNFCLSMSRVLCTSRKSMDEAKSRDNTLIGDHSFSTGAKVSGKLIFLTPCAYQGVRNVKSSENFAYVLNK